MKLLQNAKEVEILHSSYLAATLSKDDNSKSYVVSIPYEGIMVEVCNFPKKTDFIGFSDVIQGGFMRIKNIFKNEETDFGVFIHKPIKMNSFSIKFEILNKRKIRIAEEDYILSIFCEYSYDNPSIIKYYPILYRLECSNGWIAVFSKSFKEEVKVKDVFNIDCIWTKCSFENYTQKYGQLVNKMREEDLNRNFNKQAIKTFKSILNISIPEEIELRELLGDRDVIDETPMDAIRENNHQLGNTKFAILNSLTSYASRRQDTSERIRMFKKVGDYISSEMESSAKKSELSTLMWNNLVQFIERK